MPPPTTRTRYATSSLSEAREFVAATYGSDLRVAAPSSSRSDLTLDRLQAGEVDLVEVALPLDLDIRAPGIGQYVFATMLSGTADYQPGRKLEVFGPGDSYLASGPDAEDAARYLQAHLTSLSLPARVVDAVAQDAGARPGAWSFTS